MKERSLTDLTEEQLIKKLTFTVFDANLLIRYLALHGIAVHADVVEREGPVRSYPECIVRVVE